jgi:hypothetical protein
MSLRPWGTSVSQMHFVEPQKLLWDHETIVGLVPRKCHSNHARSRKAILRSPNSVQIASGLPL